MKIAQNSVVELIYELVVDGQIADKTTADRPLSFIQGTGSLLPKFEKSIEGLEPGGKFAFTLTPEEGYGTWDPERMINLPLQAFEVDGVLRKDLLVAGATVPLMNAMGAVIPAKVVEVGTDSVKMDLNHPMAGKTLNFTGEILTVREATGEELTNGLHGEKCGGDCGSCGGKCHGGDGEQKEECCGEKGKKKEGCCGKGKGKCHKKEEEK